MSKKCGIYGCERNCYGDYCIRHKPRKALRASVRPKKMSARELDYQQWLKDVARPYVAKRDGNRCACCGNGGLLDLDHILNKGSHPELKRNLDNLQFLCRPCHRLKTDRVVCNHA